MNNDTFTLPWLLRCTHSSMGEINVRLQINASGALCVASDTAGQEFHPATLQEEILTVGGRSLFLDTAVAEQVHEVAQAWKMYNSLQGSMFDPRDKRASFVYEQEAERFQEETGWRVSHIVLTKSPALV